MTTPFKMIYTAFGLLTIAALYGARANDIDGYHPICTEVAHEVSIAYHEDRLSREQATRIIDNCFAWQDRIGR